MTLERDGLGLYGPSTGWMSTQVTMHLGRPFVFPTGSQVGDAISNGWEWDRVLRDLLEKLVPEEEPVVLEVGSNIGASLMEILAAKPKARVYPFEPSDRYRAYLEYNLQLAGADHIKVSPRLVSREAGTGFVHTDGTSGSIRPMPHLIIRQEAEITTLDATCSDKGRVCFIKTDTDGNDMEVLAGAEQILRRDQPPIFMEFCPQLMLSDPLKDLAWLQSLGYRRLVGLSPTGALVGVTTEGTQLVKWAGEHGYIDVVSCADRTHAERSLDGLLASLPPATTPSPA